MKNYWLNRNGYIQRQFNIYSYAPEYMVIRTKHAKVEYLHEWRDLRTLHEPTLFWMDYAPQFGWCEYEDAVIALKKARNL